ncbi:MAG: glycine cleavage system aminomethyltransferase GcvT [Rhodobiaceae bacterium]|nr:glycine cleavage system aminomethyltransferase GcvT [Rhodobiaceae bacterium]MCC0014507.1 glycine cleavage system aminomethyltransferase GcvT [Rhodobiaceae bacterium]MCC0050651.1 glycine cleavage system aminomethyltransferase GcvT [Rhodobiaceae bacterium]MCC0059854.1 glycine cleavage system aminomethyltransferase GcvT [Rhodobiaceae bacterium]
MAEADDTGELLLTPLHALHVALGARMVPFAGYDMPVQYPTGIIKEHTATRVSAGLFDVSHMGQAHLQAEDGRHETVSAALETLIPAEILGLEHGQQRYSQLLNADGGILDDLMVTRPASAADDGRLLLVVNAACKEADYAHIAAKLPSGVSLHRLDDRALIAIQGPKAADAVAPHVPGAAGMAFMEARPGTFDGLDIHLSRSGYTGEDGYEISVASAHAETVWNTLAGDERVSPVGLGARDTLRLEAGLCLYGHDIDETTSPVEAGLLWSIGKRRREEGGFPGADRILREIADGPSRRRVGIRPSGRAPAREGTQIADTDGNGIGTVTSGGFGPTVGGPVAMGYVATEFAKPGTALQLMLRGRAEPAEVVKLPFVPPGFHRG